MVAADQSMANSCFGEDLTGLVDDDFHALPLQCNAPRHSRDAVH